MKLKAQGKPPSVYQRFGTAQTLKVSAAEAYLKVTKCQSEAKTRALTAVEVKFHSFMQSFISTQLTFKSCFADFFVSLSFVLVYRWLLRVHVLQRIVWATALAINPFGALAVRARTVRSLRRRVSPSHSYKLNANNNTCRCFRPQNRRS